MDKFIVESEINGKWHYFTGVKDGSVYVSTDITKAIIFEKFGRALRKAKQISGNCVQFHVGKVSVNVRLA